MTITVAVRDETTSGTIGNELVLAFFTQQVSVRSLIRERIKQEIEAFNAEGPSTFRGLIQPTGAERTLNGFKLPAKRHLDWEKQAELAERAFLTNGFLLLAGERQLTELDEVIEIRPNTTITFLKLIPLVGG